MNHDLTRLGLLAWFLAGALHCSASSLCVDQPMDERCRPELLQEGQDDRPRCTHLKLKARRITGSASLILSADNGKWIFSSLGTLTAVPGGPVANTPEAFAAFANTRTLQTLDKVWFHFAVPTTQLPDGSIAVFRLQDDVWNSAGLEVKLGQVQGSASLRNVPLELSTSMPLPLDANPRIQHIGSAGNKIWLLRSGSADGGSWNFDRAQVVDSSLLFEPLFMPLGRNQHKDLLADFSSDRIIFLDPRQMTTPERSMAVTNCPASTNDWTNCPVAAPPLLMPRAKAFALSRDASRGAVVDQNGNLHVAKMSTVNNARVDWSAALATFSNSVWLRFADLDGDEDDDLVAVTRTAPPDVYAFKSTSGTYAPALSLSKPIATALQSSNLSALTVGQLSPGSVHAAFVSGDTLTVLESQCGAAFQSTKTFALAFPENHAWASGALAIGDMTADGKPDLILGYTTKHKSKEEFLQHLRVYPGP